MRLPGSVAEIQASPRGPKVGAFFDALEESASRGGEITETAAPADPSETGCGS